MAGSPLFHHSPSRSSGDKWRLYYRDCLLPVSIRVRAEARTIPHYIQIIEYIDVF